VSPDQAGQIPPGATAEDLHRFCRATVAAFREAHGFVAESREDSRKIMIWLGGLMGAGILSVHGLLATAPQLTRLTVLLSWTAGMLFAMLAVFLGGETAIRNNAEFFDRMTLLELLRLETDVELIRRNLPRAIDPGVIELQPANIVLGRWLVATNVAFYFAILFFIVGVVAAATTLILLGK
jgi:hypothetical protein